MNEQLPDFQSELILGNATIDLKKSRVMLHFVILLKNLILEYIIFLFILFIYLIFFSKLQL